MTEKKRGRPPKKILVRNIYRNPIFGYNGDKVEPGECYEFEKVNADAIIARGHGELVKQTKQVDIEDEPTADI